MQGFRGRSAVSDVAALSIVGIETNVNRRKKERWDIDEERQELLKENPFQTILLPFDMLIIVATRGREKT